MNKPTLGRQRPIDFQVTPMIDVVFLLIIFFLVSSYLASHETPTSVDLPRATAIEPTAIGPRVGPTIDVTQEGQLVWDRTPLTIDQVARRLVSPPANETSERLVRIRADRATPYREIERLLLACQQAGIEEVTFAVIEQRREGRRP